MQPFQHWVRDLELYYNHVQFFSSTDSSSASYIITAMFDDGMYQTWHWDYRLVGTEEGRKHIEMVIDNTLEEYSRKRQFDEDVSSLLGEEK